MITGILIIGKYNVRLWVIPADRTPGDVPGILTLYLWAHAPWQNVQRYKTLYFAKYIKLKCAKHSHSGHTERFSYINIVVIPSTTGFTTHHVVCHNVRHVLPAKARSIKIFRNSTFYIQKRPIDTWPMLFPVLLWRAICRRTCTVLLGFIGNFMT